MTKKYIAAGILLVISVLMINSVYALAVSSPYWDGNPLKISPGESIDLQLVLKNNAGAEALTVGAVVAEGSNVATITDSSKNYNVPAGGEAVVNVRVSVPANSQIGRNYPVIFSFKTSDANNVGAVGIGSSIDTKLPITIAPKEKVPSTGINIIFYLEVAIAIIIILIIALALSKKKKR